MTGRAFLYGLGAAGQRGAEQALALLDTELRRTMALTGQCRMSELTPDLIAWRDTLTE
jgi:L-lactate dehydrogenase (cytochrome)